MFFYKNLLFLLEESLFRSTETVWGRSIYYHRNFVTKEFEKGTKKFSVYKRKVEVKTSRVKKQKD
jgi:hypothetical protein